MILPAMASTRLILVASEGTAFPPNCNLVVDVGKKQPDELAPKEEETSMGIVGLRSVLPPGALPDRYA
jgi:hypothetical protein